MIKVTKAEFFAAIGPRDVMPKVDVSSLRDRHHVSQWEVQHTRELVGMTKSDSWGIEPAEFHLVKVAQ